MSMNIDHPFHKTDLIGPSDEDVKTFQTKIKMEPPKKATEEQKNNLRLYFTSNSEENYISVKNIVIEFINGKVINSREHYAVRDYKVVKMFCNIYGGIRIVGYGSKSSDGQMIIPGSSIATVGVDQDVGENCRIEN